MLADLLVNINAWVMGIIESMGYLGLGLVMFLENVFPPIPSELVLPFAGWLTIKEGSQFTLLGVTLVGAIGSVLGAYFFYGLGRWFDEKRVRFLLQRFGKWFLLSEKDLDTALEWSDKYGEYVVFFARMVPLVRSIISVPAGLAKMNFGRFTLYTALGTALWSFILAFAGRLLGSQWEMVIEIIDQYENVVIVLGVLGVVGFFGYRLWQKSKEKEEGKAEVTA